MHYVCRVNAASESTPQTILCTVDFSATTQQSIEWGIIMARQLRAHLTILFVYRLILDRGGEIFHLKKAIEEEAQRKFNELEKDFLNGQGLSYDFKIEVGFVSDRIEDYAKKTSLRFLVINRSIESNSNETLDELFEHIHIPMLLVP